MALNVHAAAPPLGFVEVTTSPVPSTATQRLAEVHDTAFKVLKEELST
jgi:hypothetical protein